MKARQRVHGHVACTLPGLPKYDPRAEYSAHAIPALMSNLGHLRLDQRVADDGDDPEEVEERIAQREDAAGGIKVPSNNDEEEDHEPDVGDISFTSAIPEKNAESVLVDFCDCLSYNRASAKRRSFAMEVKRFVRRSRKDDELDAKIRAHIKEARIDLVIQAGHVFIQDETKDSIMVIAAAENLSSNDPSYRPPDKQLFDRALKWNKILRLDGTSSAAASKACLRTVCKKMREMGD
ncbi:hypothetical protein EDB19DRAFT_2021339 [Suillus lakei]|nr:hypothetical protein EDB19DRAFT_2021339 [Suillus lakei]